MGPKASTIVDPNESAVFQNYDIIQEIPNQNIRFLQHKVTKKQYLLRQLSFNDKKQYEKTTQTVKTKIQQLKNNQHIVPIVQFFKKQEDQYCSTFYKIYVLFEFPQRTLDDQINQRNLKKNTFIQNQLWSILASCILGMSHLQKKGIKHGCLKSSSILLSEQGVIKVYDPFTLMQTSNYEMLLNKRQTRHVYLSPEQCQALQNETISPILNVYKSDIFTLGMIIIQCGLLSYQDECYRDEYSRLHWQTLEYNKNRFSKIYSEQLTNMISYMLQKNERMRPEWIQLQEHVMKVQDNVRDSFISNSGQNAAYRQSKAITATKPLSSFIRPFGQSNGIHNQPFRNSSVITGVKNNDFFNSKPVSAKINRQFQNFNQTGQFIRNLGPYNNRIQNNPSFGITEIVNKAVPVQTQKNIINKDEVNASINKNDLIAPIKTSQISLTRPLKSFFPNPHYIVKTKIDENLIVVQDEGSNSQIYSESEKSRGSMNQAYNHSSHNNTNFQQSNPNFSPYNHIQSQNSQNRFQQSVTNSANSFHVPIQHQQSIKGQFVVQTFKLGSKYQGFKYNGMRNGQGKFFYQDGGMYDGNWVNNKMQGFGRLFYQSGKIAYQGQWIQDQFTGNGRLFNQNPDELNQAFNYSNFDDVEEYWTKYEGQFLQDMKHGKGVLYLSNGQTFSGIFNNDVVEGQGTYNSLNGKVRGIWENNSLVRKY